MTLAMLQYFIAVAEKGSFTDAAAVCFVSQPALSRAIASLERELGCPLIDRDAHKTIQLTKAGEVMLIEARRVLSCVDLLQQRVQSAKDSSFINVTVGYIAYGMLNRFRKMWGGALEMLSEQGIRLHPVYGSAPEIKERVLSGELDCAILPDSSTWDMPNCRKRNIAKTESRIVIPKKHPLFGAETVQMEQLHDSDFVFFDPKELPMTMAYHLQICQEAGFTPRIVAYGKKMGDVADLCCQYSAVAIVSDVFEYAASQDVAIVPIAGTQYTYDLTLIAKEKSGNPLVDKIFAEIVRDDLPE